MEDLPPISALDSNENPFSDKRFQRVSSKDLELRSNRFERMNSLLPGLMEQRAKNKLIQQSDTSSGKASVSFDMMQQE